MIRDRLSTSDYVPKATTKREKPDSTANLVQVTKRGVELRASATDLQNLSHQFQAQKWVRLSGFFDHELLELLQRKIEESEFLVVDRVVGMELRPIDNTAYLSAELLLNTPKLFRLMEVITGCARIASFAGRIYRRPPGGDYFNRWHTDINDEGRVIALSVNLSTDSFSGGATEIRLDKSREVIARISNPVPGDAIIFPIDESLHHRVGRVEGGSAKTALAGWFKSKPDPNSVFGRGNLTQTNVR